MFFRLAWFWVGKVNAQVWSTCDVCDNVTCDNVCFVLATLASNSPR